jgi:hypothetical protein
MRDKNTDLIQKLLDQAASLTRPRDELREDTAPDLAGRELSR